MSIKLYALTAVAVSAVTSIAFAQPGPSMVRKFADWGVYSYQSSGSKTCYVLTTPQQAQPASVNHGDNFFLVAPNQSGSGYYPQAIMGYDLREGTQMVLTIDGKPFVMMPKGNSGWTQEASNDAALINAMKAGSNMTLRATSQRGTSTSYTFSLSGITAALDQAASCN
jgi:invasion protein IalB